jgi:hypothetical protein
MDFLMSKMVEEVRKRYSALKQKYPDKKVNFQAILREVVIGAGYATDQEEFTNMFRRLSKAFAEDRQWREEHPFARGWRRGMSL